MPQAADSGGREEELESRTWSVNNGKGVKKGCSGSKHGGRGEQEPVQPTPMEEAGELGLWNAGVTCQDYPEASRG